MIAIRYLLRITSVFVAIGAFVGVSYAGDGSFTANRFCYAIQSAGWCDNFFVRVDTEERLRQQVGADLRGKDSPYHDDCTEGMDRFWSEMDAYGVVAACERAWDAVGPLGSEFSGLLIESPF